MSSFNIDASALLRLEEDLEGAEISREEIRGVVDKGLLNIKGGMQRRWRGHPSIRGLAPAVSYDSELTSTGARGEVGPVVGRYQGSLGGIIEGGREEYGNLKNAPIPAAKPEAEIEEPKFVKALTSLAEGKVEGR